MNLPAISKTDSIRGENRFPPEVIEYLSSDRTVLQIAADFGISPATLVGRVKKFGVRRRARGRRAAAMPNLKHALILSLTRHSTYAQVAKHVGCSKQRIHKIVQRWRHLLPAPHQKNPMPKVCPETPPIAQRRLQKKAGRSIISPCDTQPHVITFRLSTKLKSSLVDARKLLGLRRQVSVNQVARAIVDRFLTNQAQNFKATAVVTA
jgi:transposase-like protein